MIAKIRSFAEKYAMFGRGDTVVCGLSGGADSVCLLLAMRGLSADIGFSVEAVHVNHCLRGTESDRDEEFCRGLCMQLGVPFRAFSCDVRGFAESASLSCEEAARKLRYDIFTKCSHGKKLATAHNADDNLETVLLNLVRGSGVKGISGIPPVRGNIIRPLLTVTRREIEDFLRNIGQNYVTDSTNLTDDYTRNKLRHNVVPLLRELNGSVVETTVRTTDVLRSENAFIEAETDKAYSACHIGGKLVGLAAYHEVIRRRCIARFLAEKLPKADISAKRLAECESIALNGGKLDLSGDIYFTSDGKTAAIEKLVPKTGEYVEKELVIGENSIFPGCRLVCSIINCEKGGFVNKKLTNSLPDYDKIIGRTVVRSRKYGDRLQLQGRNFTSSVKKLINETIPVSQRQTLHFIEDELGTVFAENIGIAQRVAPDENTVRLLKITVEREEQEGMF